jgi:tetratricopeptide (TPR) repeat protein
MRPAWNLTLLGECLLAGLLVALMGIGPRPYHVEEELLHAHQFEQSGLPLIAAQGLARAAEHYPWRSDLLIEAGRLAWEARDAQATILYLETAATRGSLPIAYQILLGDAYQQSGMIDQAIDTWQELIKTDSNQPAIYIRLVEAHRLQRNYAALADDLKALSILYPNDLALYYELGLLLAAVQPESALAYLELAANGEQPTAANARELQREIRTATLWGEPAYTLTAAGRALAALNKWDLAEQAFLQATQLRPDYAEAWAFLGEARYHLTGLVAPLPGMTPYPTTASQSWAGLKELQQALQLDPGSLAANLLLSLFWQRHGDYEQALSYLQVAINQDAENPALVAELGNLYDLRGDLNEASQAYQAAIWLAPKDSKYWLLLAEFALRNQFQLKELAIPAARQALLIEPDSAHALDTLGQAYLLTGDLITAERFLQRSLQADPDYAPAHLHSGVLALYQGELEQARQAIIRALDLASGTPIATQAQRLLETYFP